MSIKETIKVLSNEMACVKRQTGPGCNRNCAACDLVLPDELVISAYQTAIDILRTKQEEEKNDPLTLEELAAMNGEPVFVTLHHAGEPPMNVWMLVYAWDEETVFLVDMNGDKYRPDEPYLEEIRRRPPKEARNG